MLHLDIENINFRHAEPPFQDFSIRERGKLCKFFYITNSLISTMTSYIMSFLEWRLRISEHFEKPIADLKH